MFIQGDVLAVLALLIGSCASAWALTLAYGLLFPGKVEIAHLEVGAHPWKCLGRGFLVLITLGTLGIALIGAAPNPALKLIGWIIDLAILCIGALGTAGIALHAAKRLRSLAPEMNSYAAFCRGSAYLILACILPLVGWLAFGPLLVLASIGAGVKAVLTRDNRVEMIPQIEAI